MSSGIKLVCFDLGRVLVRICDNWQHACRVVGVKTPPRTLNADESARLFEWVCRAEVGAADTRAFAAGTAPLLGLSAEEVVALSNAYIFGPYPGAIDLLHELSEAGVTTACLSNTNENHWRMLGETSAAYHFPLDCLTHRFASHLIRARKPDAASYAHVERETATPPDQILFFDDLPENITAAAARGWRACHVDPKRDPIEQIRTELLRAGVLR